MTAATGTTFDFGAGTARVFGDARGSGGERT